MSTHIETGFRLAKPGLDQLVALLPRWRKQFLALAHETQDRWVAARAAEIIDRQRLAARALEIADVDIGPLPGYETGVEVPALSAALGEMKNRQRRSAREQSRDPRIDFEMKLVFIPYGDTIYGLAFTEQGDWLQALYDDPAIQHFPYWNNTDGPNHIDPSDWRARGNLWSAVIGAGAVGQRGLSAALVASDWLALTTPAKAVASQPDLDARAKPHALALELTCASTWIDRSSVSEVVRLHYEIQAGRIGDLAGTTARIAKILSPRLTIADFTRDPA